MSWSMLMTFWSLVVMAAITSLIAQLNSEFSLKDLREVHYFLGIQASHTNNGLHLS